MQYLRIQKYILKSLYYDTYLASAQKGYAANLILFLKKLR